MPNLKASILLPTYNEAENIVPLIQQIFKVKPSDWDVEILVIDDNSPDGTYAIIERTFKDEPRVIPILRTQDRGLAKSLRAGVERAQGDWVAFMGSDFAHDPVELPKMMRIAGLYDIVMGSRFCAGGNMEHLPHYLLSLIYNWFIRIILRTQIQDNLGGYIFIRRKALLALPLEKIFYGYGEFAFRMLHYAQNRGVTIVEIPIYVRTRQKGNSKSHFFLLLFQYTWAAIRLKWDVLLHERHWQPESSSVAN